MRMEVGQLIERRIVSLVEAALSRHLSEREEGSGDTVGVMPDLCQAPEELSSRPAPALEYAAQLGNLMTAHEVQ